MLKGQEITMKPHQIAEAILTWRNWSGFSGETCWECKSTINTFGHGPGWFCPSCNNYNCQSFSTNCPIHKEPDYGPDRTTICKGFKLSVRDTRRQRLFADGEKVIVDIRESTYGCPVVWRSGRIIRMEEKCYFGMRYYQVLVPSGKRRFYEANVRKSSLFST